EIDAVRQMVLSTPPQGFIGCCHAIKNMDLRASAPSITAPTRVIVGADDPSTTPAHAAEIVALISGADLVEIPASAHFLNVEQAGAFNAALLEHLTVQP
ncbi:MAG: alpha/beta hydrolase, partial [Alphaproteobacteria bacterium]|nr:alpha/beta hydrolase [Alphaproteobacteria bacterium]